MAKHGGMGDLESDEAAVTAAATTDTDAAEDESAAGKTADLTAAMHFAQVENDTKRSKRQMAVIAVAAVAVVCVVGFGVHALLPAAKAVHKAETAGSSDAAQTEVATPASASGSEDDKAATGEVSQSVDGGSGAVQSTFSTSKVGGNALPAPSGSRAVTSYSQVVETQTAESAESAGTGSSTATEEANSSSVTTPSGTTDTGTTDTGTTDTGTTGGTTDTPGSDSSPDSTGSDNAGSSGGSDTTSGDAASTE